MHFPWRVDFSLHTAWYHPPGPLTAAGLLGVDVGQMIMIGLVISIPMLLVIVPYCKWVGKKIYQVPAADGEYERKEFKEEYLKSMDEVEKLMGEKNLPSLEEPLHRSSFQSSLFSSRPSGTFLEAAREW